MKNLLLASAVTASLLPLQSVAQIQFQEDFESSGNPFGFDSYNNSMEGASSHFSGESVFADEQLGQVWKTTFYDSRNDTYFGHRVNMKADWNITNRIHWAGYIKFGDEPNAGDWVTVDGNTRMGARSYELKIPDIFPGRPEWQAGRIIGKMRSMDNGNKGRFVVYTPDGQDHAPQELGDVAPFESGRWYSLEFMVEDNGSNDTVKIWIDNNDEGNPDYAFTGGDMFDSQYWGQNLRFDHGYRNHNVGRPTNFYYDSITIANSFIGLTPPGEGSASAGGDNDNRSSKPSAPSGLRVDG